MNGLRRLADAWHRRVMADDVVAHAFSMASTPSMLSDSPRTGRRRLAARARIPIPMGTRQPSSRCTAGTESTMKWTAARSPASTRLWPMSDWPATLRCGKCCTTTLPGRPRQRWLATIIPPMTAGRPQHPAMVVGRTAGVRAADRSAPFQPRLLRAGWDSRKFSGPELVSSRPGEAWTPHW